MSDEGMEPTSGTHLLANAFRGAAKSIGDLAAGMAGVGEDMKSYSEQKRISSDSGREGQMEKRKADSTGLVMAISATVFVLLSLAGAGMGQRNPDLTWWAGMLIMWGLVGAFLTLAWWIGRNP